MTLALPRPARLTALSAAALLALTACGGQDTAESSASSPEAGAPTSAAASPTESASASQAGSSSAAPVEHGPGTCFTAPLGARDLSNFEETDCAEEHTAEYLWPVPAVAEGEEASSTSAAVCQAAGERLSEREEIGAGTVLSAAELSSFGMEGTHCVVYAVSGQWKGQIVDPATTLEKAAQEAPAATS